MLRMVEVTSNPMLFDACEDAWVMYWRARTGISLDTLKARWDRLEEWSEQDEQALVPNYQRKKSGLYGGPVGSMIANVEVLGYDYLDSYPEGLDTGCAGPLHRAIVRLDVDRGGMVERAKSVLREVQYRMELQAAADRYLEMMEIDRPAFQRCCDFDSQQIRGNVEGQKYSETLRLIMDRGVLFPRPVRGEEGHGFCKGRDYLVEAFDIAKFAKGNYRREIGRGASAAAKGAGAAGTDCGEG